MLKRVGAISDNLNERTRGNRRRGYGFSILFLLERNDDLDDCQSENQDIQHTEDGKKGTISPSPEKGAF